MLYFELLLLLATSTLNVAYGLRISSVEVPPAVMNASQVTLVCNYDLQGDQLYSVKWYKNYVEFYRFQPSANESLSGAPPAAAALASSQSQMSAVGAADNQQHSKHEFELDGINLNLSKSNATHVYLRQASLASEGTYKCEVSAESPSFATISIERQMKVYILPKQKLSIVDNSMVAGAAPQQAPSPPTNLIYNINDFVNLTCVSSASRPMAKLTWLLNDLPVAATSKWLQHSSAAKTQQGGGEQLIETRLTLAFKLQASHLSKGLTVAGGGSSAASHGTIEPTARYQSLKVRCLAKLSVQFSSESSIIVSGGKTTIKRRQEMASSQAGGGNTLLPAPSSLSSTQHEQNQAPADGQDRTRAKVFGTPDYPIYHWPRPLIVSAAAANGARQGGRRNASHDMFTSDPWLITAHSSARQQTGSELLDGINQGDADLLRGSAGGHQRSSTMRHLVVWTNRQLRDQAEHIDSVMRLAHPNELDIPIIEGKIQPTENPLEGESNYGNNPDDQGGADSTTTSSNDWTGFTTSNKPPIAFPTSTTQDYELDDLVQFFCKPRVSFAEGNSIKSVMSKWFINDKEISAHLINAFDGNKFYYSRDLYDVPSGSGNNQLRPSSVTMTTTTQYQNPSSAELESNQDTQPDQTAPVAQTQMLRQQNNSTESSLLVEFSSSLFQLKELNLKCRTVVEQPLIQYDSQVVILVPTNQFIQAVPPGRHKPGGAFYKNRPNGGIYGNKRGKNNNAQSSSSSISALKFNWQYVTIFIIANYLVVM